MNPVWHFLNGVPQIGPLRVTSTQIQVADGTASAPTYSFSSDPTLGIYGSANAVNIAIGGTQRHFFGAAAYQLVSDSAAIFLGLAGDISLSRAAADVLTTPDRFVSTGPTAGIGYATGAGGAQTQLTSKATTVVSNTVTGEITMHNATLNAATAVTFALTNSAIATGDMVLVQHVSAGTLGAYVCQAVAGAGTANITVTNRTAGNLGEAIVLKYIVFKAVTA